LSKLVDRRLKSGIEEAVMSEDQEPAKWTAAEWHGKMLVDREGEKIGKLQDVYVDIENDQPQFATVKEGVIGRHLTFVPLGGLQIGPDDLRVVVTKEQVRSAPDIELHGEELLVLLGLSNARRCDKF
jgi:sporulation protein YlmC with PRC-barrel domain